MEKLSRRAARENAFVTAFAASFDGAMPQDVIELNKELGEHVVDAFGQRLINDYYDHSAEINDMIRDHLKGWTIDRLPRVSLVVLRLALSEMFYGEEKLTSVAINEAVELIKKFGGDDDYQFVNGVLGAIARENSLSDATPKQE